MQQTTETVSDSTFGEEQHNTTTCFDLQPEMELLTLENQVNGELMDFDMVGEEDLPWLDADTEMGLKLRHSIVQVQIDDDTMTDDEQMENAQKMLMKSLEEAISDFQGFN